MVNIRAHVYVSGRVQGVFFRQSTQSKAWSLDVKGWVRNLPDGRVEAVFEGDQSAVKQLVDWCSHGPPAAKVQNVTVGFESFSGEFVDFNAL